MFALAHVISKFKVGYFTHVMPSLAQIVSCQRFSLQEILNMVLVSYKPNGWQAFNLRKYLYLF